MHFCPRCIARRERQVAHNVVGRTLFLAVFAIALLIAGGLLGGPTLRAAGFGLLNLVLWTLLTEILIIPHEAAHVGGARAVGVRVFEVRVGTGPLVATWRAFGLTVRVHALPFAGGQTQVGFTTRRLMKTKWLLTTAAGPAVHLLLVAPWLVGSWQAQWSALLAGPALGPAFLLANAWLFVVNTLPWKPVRASDGLVLLTTPFLPEAELDRLVQAYPLMEALVARDEGRLEDALEWLDRAQCVGTAQHLLHRGMVLALVGRNAAARDSFQQALAAGGEAGPLGPALWNNIAWADTMLDEPGLLEEADTLSRRAVEAAPWSPPFKGTRGSVLVWKAAHQEAIPLLREALADPEELHPMAHATYRAALCLALIAVGEREAAAKELARGEAAYPSCVLLARARAAVGMPSTSQASYPASEPR